MASLGAKSKTTLVMSPLHYRKQHHSNSSLSQDLQWNHRINLAIGSLLESLLLQVICSSQILARKIDQARVYKKSKESKIVARSKYNKRHRRAFSVTKIEISHSKLLLAWFHLGLRKQLDHRQLLKCLPVEVILIISNSQASNLSARLQLAIIHKCFRTITKGLVLLLMEELRDEQPKILCKS